MMFWEKEIGIGKPNVILMQTESKNLYFLCSAEVQTPVHVPVTHG